MDRCQVDCIQTSFSKRGEVGKKYSDISTVRLDTVFRQPSFRDKVVEIQFVRCAELCGELCSFDGASAVRHWLLFQNTERIRKPDRNQAFVNGNQLH